MEAHAWALVHGLRARGHDVALIASGDSCGEGELVSVADMAYEAALPWHRYHGTQILNDHLDAIFRRACNVLRSGTFDVVHNNSLHRFPPRYAAATGQPTVTSLHVPPFEALQRAVHDSAAPWALSTTTSAAQLDRWWSGAPAPSARVLPNGIDTNLWPFEAEGDGTAVWAGRLTRTKGAGYAIDAARRAGVPLTLFGTIEDATYFEEEVRPRLGGGIRYGGHLEADALAIELGRASVFVFTPIWDEPFGLAAIEAMSCGLPVAAFASGAVREVVGPAGVFAEPGDVEGLADAIGEAMCLPREAARARVEAEFTLDLMLDRCEALYREARAARPTDRNQLRNYSDYALPAVAAE